MRLATDCPPTVRGGAKQRTPTLVVFATCVLATALYWFGLDGPLLFDDYGNLAPVDQWLSGQVSTIATMFPNPESVVFSRPLAMASFMLTASIQQGTFLLKLGNLFVHLACALVAWRVMRRAFALDPVTRPHAAAAAALVVAVWLVHPLHVSTVLYGVQRMAQLSTLFTLLAVLVYLAGREHVLAGRRWRGLLQLFVGAPLLCLAGLLSKQNAVVAPLLCLAFEVAYFSRGTRPATLRAFFALSVALPGLIALLVLVTSPQRVLSGYGELEFTLGQRLLTQPVALVEYLWSWLLPYTPGMGLYTDAFPISTGLLSPPITMLSIVILAAITLAAFACRRQCPSLLAGWLFFLLAHAVESTFLPIEMYYEHRNYLPSFGLLLAIAGLVAMLGSTPPFRGWSRRTSFAACVGLVAALSFSTFGRVLVWQDEAAMIEQGFRHHPESLRLRQDRVTLALRTGNFAQAWETIDPMLESDDPRFRLIGSIDAVAVACAQGREPRIDAMVHEAQNARPRLTVYEVHAAQLLETATRQSECAPQLPAVAAETVVRIVEAASGQPEHTGNKTMLRRLAGQLFARSGKWRAAMAQSELAWRGEKTLPTGSLLVRSYVRSGRHQDALRILESMHYLRGSDGDAWKTELAVLRQMVSAG